MKRIALTLAAFALTGALAFAQDAPAAPVVALHGYLGTGFMLYGNNGATGQLTTNTLSAMDRNNGGAVDFRANFTLATPTDGVQFSFWNSSATGSFAGTNLQYVYAWASFLDNQVVTKVGLQDDNTTGSENMGYGSNDVPNTSGTNVPGKTAFGATGSGNIPGVDVVAKPAAVPGLAIDYFLPTPAQTAMTVNAGNAFASSRIGAAYGTDLFKVVANYMLDGTAANTPAFDFGVKVTPITGLKIRVEGSYAIAPNSSTAVTSQFIQDVGYTIPVNDTDSFTPYIYVREFLSPNGVAAGTNNAANWLASKNSGSITDLEFMPAVTYATKNVTYNLTLEYATTSGSTVNGVTSVYALEPAVTFALPAAQSIQIGAAFGTMGNDALDGNFGQNIGGVTNSTSYGNNSAYELYLDYEYSF